jgi:hypothetical protein
MRLIKILYPRSQAFGVLASLLGSFSHEFRW